MSADPVKTMAATPGFKTSEFWFTAVGNLVAAVTATLGQIEAEWAVLVVGLLNSAYTIGRSLVKRG